MWATLILMLSLSLVDTDYYQSAPVLGCTQEQPCTIGGERIWEGNGDFAGRPDEAARQFRWQREAVVRASTRTNLLHVILRGAVVASNWQNLAAVGLPEVVMISWRGHF